METSFIIVCIILLAAFLAPIYLDPKNGDWVAFVLFTSAAIIALIGSILY